MSRGLGDVYKRQAREISDRVLFICDGVIKEEGTPEQIFTCPHEPSTIKFLSMVL